MKAVVFGKAARTSTKKAPPAAARQARGEGRGGVERRAIEDLPSVLPDLPADTFVYVDVTGLTGRERARALARALEKAPGRVGIVDPKGTVKDVASLFHAGFVDYIGKSVSLAALGSKRLAAVREFAARDGVDGQGAEKTEVRSSPAGAGADGWGLVEDGREHRFAFLFVEVDDAEEMKRRYEPANIASAMETFHGFVERIVAQHGGRTWMWSRFGGLALFPLREPDFPAVLCGLRLILSGIFYDAEESPLPGRLSFRLALAVGSTLYKANDTGRIVSDAVNSIFHLGRRFARAGQFLLTAEAAALVPEPLRPLMAPAGTYEGQRILRLLKPAPVTSVRG